MQFILRKYIKKGRQRPLEASLLHCFVDREETLPACNQQNRINAGGRTSMVMSLITLLSFVTCLQANAAGYARPVKAYTGDKENINAAIRIKGHVSDEKGGPLVGASIIIKGTKIGTIADADGAFAINAPAADATLVVSFQGYITQEIAINGHINFDIKLQPASNVLNEVAVLGYTTVLKKDLTGSVSTLTADQITRVQSNNIVSSLVGVPGLRVNGDAADVQDIRIHGNRSVLANNAPLIMLDGMPYSGSLNTVDQYDVESINILKDASSTALYGSKGANGVIVITTKKGKKGQNSITFDSFNGVNVHEDGNLHPMNATQYIQFKRDANQATATSSGIWNSPADDSKIFTPQEIAGFGTVNNKAAEQFYNKLGFTSNNTLTFMGADDKGSKKISLNFYNNNGRGANMDNYDRYILSTDVQHQALKHLRVGMSTRVSYEFRQAAPANFGQNLFRFPATVNMFDADGNPIVAPTGDPNMRNPYLDLNHDHNDSESRAWEGVMRGYAVYSFSNALTLTTSASADIAFNWTGAYVDNQSSAYNNADNQASLSNDRRTKIAGNAILEYKKNFGKHSIDATGAFEIQNNQSLKSSESGQGISLSQYKWYNLDASLINHLISSDFTRDQMLSYLGRVQYGYKDKYLFTATARADGASPLADHQWQIFPSGAAAWRIIEEPFMKDLKAVSDLKIRVSYGLSGNSSIAAYGTQGNLTSRYTIFGSPTGDIPYATNEPNLQPTPDLRWETTATFNIGVDYGFFNNRITGSFDWYSAHTYDLLNKKKLPYTTGFNTIYANVGKSRNRGYEIALNAKVIDNRDFKWNVTLSFYHNKEELVELYDPRLTQDIANNWFVGQPVSGVVYDYKALGIWQTNEVKTANIYGRNPGEIKIADLNGDGKIDGNDREIVGNERPNIESSMITSLTWKNFDVAMDFYSEYGALATDNWTGNLSYASTGRYNAPVFDYWTPTNPTNNAPEPRSGLSPVYLSAIARHTNNYIRLRNATLGYTFSKNLVKGINKLRLYASATNPLQYWSYLQEGGLSDKTVIYNLGLNVSF